MAQITVPNIPSASSVEDLRASIVQALNILVTQLNAGDGAQLNANNQRITNVGMCASLYDGVPKIYVDQKLDDLNLEGTGSRGQYTIVYSNDAPTDGYTSSPYAVGSDRSGQIEDVWLTAAGAPSSTCSVNFVVNGTHTLLSTAISLSSGTSGPVHSRNFAANIPFFNFNTTAQMVIISAGGATLLSGGIVIRRI